MIGRCFDVRGDEIFAAALARDPEVSFLERLERMQGRPWVLDRRAPDALGAGVRGAAAPTAKVAPAPLALEDGSSTILTDSATDPGDAEVERRSKRPLGNSETGAL